MSKVLDNKCPSCNAPLFYNAKTKNFKCDYCNKEYTVDELKKPIEKERKGKSKTTDNVTYVKYNCPDCGAEVISDENTVATFCLYCGNANIIKDRIEGIFKPDRIIPFKKTKEDAIEAFKSLKKGRKFIPNDFTSEQNIEKITGLYVPFWLFDVGVGGTLEVTTRHVSSWQRGNTVYTKTDVYKHVRQGNMLFDSIPHDGSSKFLDDIMDSIEPYDRSEYVPFDHAYLAGFLAEKYDVPSSEVEERVKNRALKTAYETFIKDINGSVSIVNSNTLSSIIRKTEYALLPVYMVNVKYKDEFYLFAMNGQTGEFIGNIPKDKKKVFIYILKKFILCSLVILLISFIMYLGGYR